MAVGNAAGGGGLVAMTRWEEMSSSDELESMSSDSSAEDMQAIKRKPKRAAERRAETCCRLRRKVVEEEQVTFVRTLCLSHLNLDELECGIYVEGTWTAISQLLGLITRREEMLTELARQFRRKKLSMPSDLIAASAERFVGRLDEIMSKGRLYKQHVDALSPSDTKSFHRCMQSWRKSFRGARERLSAEAKQTLHSRWTTCWQVALLYHCGDEDASLVYCPAVGRETIETITIPQQLSWGELSICCESLAQWTKCANTLVPQLSATSLRLTEYVHRSDARNVSNDFADGRLTLPLPPVVYSSSVVVDTLSTRYAEPSTPDSQKIIAILERHGQHLKSHVQKSTTSLLALAAWRAQQTDKGEGHTALLPVHLSDVVRNVYRCSSCEECVVPPIRDADQSFSSNFEREAVRAGFDLIELHVKMLLTSLKSNSVWLPPFHETIVPKTLHAQATAAHTSKLYIGGYSIAHERNPALVSTTDERNLAWRFCLPCFAAHVRLPGYGRTTCACIVCKADRRDGGDASTLRYVRLRVS